MPGDTFVDTNVWVYAVDVADLAKQRRAQALIGELGASAVISAQVLSEFWTVVTRKLSPPLTHAQAIAAVDALAELAVVPVDTALVRDAARLTTETSISLWDAQIVWAARRAGCTRLLTEDLSAGTSIAEVMVENPFSPRP